MRNDPIMEEVWRLKDQYASKHGYDPQAIFEDLQELQRTSGRKYITEPFPETHPVKEKSKESSADSSLSQKSMESRPDDSIIQEVRRIKEEFAAEFGYDLEKMFQYLKEQEKENQDRLVSFTQDPDRSEISNQ